MVKTLKQAGTISVGLYVLLVRSTWKMLPHPTVRNECPVMFSTVMWPESSPPALTVLVVSTRLADRDGLVFAPLLP
jgi:hypothetical protein